MTIERLLPLIAIAVIGAVCLALLTRRSQNSGRDPFAPPIPGMITSANAITVAQVTDLLRRQRKIEAIKIYREATGVSLSDAKNLVEAIEKKM